MNALAASPCNVGIIFTGVAILLLSLILTAKLVKISQSCKELARFQRKRKKIDPVFAEI
jgi:hypothetical protein